MKLVDISCPSCGAVMSVSESANSVVCDFCGKSFLIDDEVRKVEHSVNNAEQAGYDFERGRIRAAKEEMRWQKIESELGYDPREVRKKPLGVVVLKIILWVCFFPIMVGYKVISSKKMDVETKLFIIVLLIGAIIYFMSGGRLWS